MDSDGTQYQIMRQRHRMEELGQQVRQFEAHLQTVRGQISAFQRRQNSQTRQVESVGDILTGLTPTTDPLNGAMLKVWTGPASGY
jgi:hypothetical protein